jgi:hypothetical protein
MDGSSRYPLLLITRAFCPKRKKADADTAKVLTEDEARRIASNIAKLPALLGAAGNPELDDFPEGGG